MAKKEVSLDRLDRELTKSTRMLGDCAGLIRDLEFNPRENIGKIGRALVEIFEIQNEIYEQRLDLTPEHLKKDLGRPWPGTRGAEEELKALRDDAKVNKHYLEWLQRPIRELGETAR